MNLITLSRFSLAVMMTFGYHVTYAQQANFNNCSLARTCSECISMSNQCVWCQWDQFAYEMKRRKGRCSLLFTEKQCPSKFRVNPKQSNKLIIENQPFSDSIDRTVQLRPQKIQVDLRVGTFVPIQIEFKQAEDYPMDLYYLMDISCTMVKHKNSVSRVGQKLAKKIQATTKDFRIGFGSYVDKETIPFSNYKFDEKTRCNKKVMVDTYSFLNHMSLNSNVSEFENQVMSAKISGNLDSPEGTLDALMQVMVCTNEIGWRKQSDKIIVVATDEEFHYAGDGKLGGILMPNDGRCHLRDGRYVQSTFYDYPSMHHIGEVAQKRKFNLVFTVSDQVSRNYQVLSNIVGQSSRVASLKVKDDTIAELIDEVYRNISNQIELVVEEKPENVVVEIWTSCAAAAAAAAENNHTTSQEPKALRRQSACQFFGKAKIEFQLKIMLKDCRSIIDPNQNLIRIGLLNKNESIEIRIKPICQCDCELDSHSIELNSKQCSFNGTFSCGICTVCNGIRSGEQCECDPEKPIDPHRPDAHCRKDINSKPCNGNGECVCAKCHCDERFSGKFCEEDQSACYLNGLKCSGHGECHQNHCQCDSSFTGDFCECPKSIESCMTDNKTHSSTNNSSQSVCFGRGHCHCGRCQCTTPTAYGRHCQHCPKCDQQLHCQLLQTCVPEFESKFCRPYFDIAKNKTINPDCDRTICSRASFAQWNYEFETEKKNEEEENDFSSRSSSSENAIRQSKSSNLNLTLRFDDLTLYQSHCSNFINGCISVFGYRLLKNSWLDEEPEEGGYDELKEREEIKFWNAPSKQLNFRLTNFTETCPKRINIYFASGFMFLVAIIAGLLIIVACKVWNVYSDKLECEKFKREIAQANFGQTENPLYKEVSATFRNPVFGIRDRTSKFFQNLNRK